jgi:hypothetical protein
MEEEFEVKEKISIEFPKNYEKLIDLKINRLEREYQDTIKRNIKEENLQNMGDIDSDSDSNSQSETKNLENIDIDNGYQQCLNNEEEFVDDEENENDNEENVNKQISYLLIK